jgi:predicted lipid-binding transport protein (Tim44 family)
MSSLDLQLMILLMLGGALLASPFLVIMLIAMVIGNISKSLQTPANNTASKAAEPSVVSATVVSPENGRVIAMEASGLQPVMPVATAPPNGGSSIAANAAKQVAGKAAASIVWYLIKILLRPRH